ncbi:zinc-dependent alcohol dehydrogenase family protein [Myxococcota bacterium]
MDYSEVSTPDPGPGEVLVRVKACGICRTDLHVVEGDLPRKRMPVIPGHQIVGLVERLGPAVTNVTAGQRVGIAWLHQTCGQCRFCVSGRENLCEAPEFTGYTQDGGFAEYAVAPADFIYPLPEGFDDLQAAPLLCAGIIGYRSLEQTGLADFRDKRLGIYGFGAAGHVVIQLARARGCKVYVITRDVERHQKLADELGAFWTGGIEEQPPAALDAAIIFAPSGELIPKALKALDKGGTLALGGIYMSPTPPIEYDLLYQERRVISVANNTRQDGSNFLKEAVQVPVRTHVETFPLEDANRALNALKNRAIAGAGVLVVGE